MQSKREDSTGELVYVVIWGNTIVPMIKIPNIGIQSMYDHDTNTFKQGRYVWDLGRNMFRFEESPTSLVQPPLTNHQA